MKALGDVPEGPLRGRAWGEQSVDQVTWKNALHEFLKMAGVTEYAVVPQGCVVKYQDGSERYIRNFSANYGFKNSLLKEITGVKRSPLSGRAIPNTKI